MVGLRLPDGAEREVLRTKWADFSGNVSSYVVRGPLLPTGGAAQGPATPFLRSLCIALRCTEGNAAQRASGTGGGAPL